MRNIIFLCDVENGCQNWFVEACEFMKKDSRFMNSVELLGFAKRGYWIENVLDFKGRLLTRMASSDLPEAADVLLTIEASDLERHQSDFDAFIVAQGDKRYAALCHQLNAEYAISIEVVTPDKSMRSIVYDRALDPEALDVIRSHYLKLVEQSEMHGMSIHDIISMPSLSRCNTPDESVSSDIFRMEDIHPKPTVVVDNVSVASPLAITTSVPKPNSDAPSQGDEVYEYSDDFTIGKETGLRRGDVCEFDDHAKAEEQSILDALDAERPTSHANLERLAGYTYLAMSKEKKAYFAICVPVYVGKKLHLTLGIYAEDEEELMLNHLREIRRYKSPVIPLKNLGLWGKNSVLIDGIPIELYRNSRLPHIECRGMFGVVDFSIDLKTAYVRIIPEKVVRSIDYMLGPVLNLPERQVDSGIKETIFKNAVSIFVNDGSISSQNPGDVDRLAFVIPVCGGKSTLAKERKGVVDIDVCTPVEDRLRLEPLKRSGDWKQVNAIFRTITGKLPSRTVLLCHSPAQLGGSWHVVCCRPTKHLLEYASQSRVSKDVIFQNFNDNSGLPNFTYNDFKTLYRLFDTICRNGQICNDTVRFLADRYATLQAKGATPTALTSNIRPAHSVSSDKAKSDISMSGINKKKNPVSIN